MTDQVDKTLGQLAFEAYRAEVNGQTFDDKQIPAWDELHGNRERVHRGWETAAQAIRQHTRMMDALGRAEDSRAAGYRSPRDGMRPLKSHAEPLSAYLRVREPADTVPSLHQQQVGDERAETARTSVPVEADDETADDAA